MSTASLEAGYCQTQSALISERKNIARNCSEGKVSISQNAVIIILQPSQWRRILHISLFFGT